MEIDKEEAGKRTVWRKYLRYEGNDVMFNDKGVSASVHCIREVSGYAVWYHRNLKDEEGSPVADGSYLLGLFGGRMRDEAIEFAVLAASPGLDATEAILALDSRAKNADKIKKQDDWLGPFF